VVFAVKVIMRMMPHVVYVASLEFSISCLCCVLC